MTQALVDYWNEIGAVLPATELKRRCILVRY